MEGLLAKWIKDVEREVLAEFKSQGRNASGGFEKDLESYVNVRPDSIKVGLRGSFYTFWLENGRKPNKDQSKVEAFAGWASNRNDGFIYKWCQTKGIAEKYAYPIALTIGKEGYKGKPLISKVFNASKINELKTIVGQQVQTDFKSQIIKQWQ